MPAPYPTPPMHSAYRRYIKDSSGNPVFTYAAYGGFVFPAAISLKMNVEPVYDSTGRIPKWWKHTFTVETVIDPSLSPMGDASTQNPVDLNMSQMRRYLTVPGQALAFWNLGIGQNQRLDLSGKSPVGTGDVAEPANFGWPITGNNLKQDPGSGSSSSHYSFYVDRNSDLNFGPKPQLLVCECIGGSRAYRIVWTVECALPNCCIVYNDGRFLCISPAHFNDQRYGFLSTALGSNLKVTEFNYGLSWGIDEDKFTTYTVVGSVEFSGTLFNDVGSTEASNFNGAEIGRAHV